jgi:PrgI family protein
MTLEAVKIPQNVYIEDRIIGPVTLRQLIICGIGCGISYSIFSMATKGGSVGIPMTIVLWIPAMISAAFAFVKVNDLTLFNIILLMIEHANKPNLRYWNSHPGISVNFISGQQQAVNEANKKLAENAVKLTELTRQLEKREQEVAKLADHSGRKPEELFLAARIPQPQAPIADPQAQPAVSPRMAAVAEQSPVAVGTETPAPPAPAVSTAVPPSAVRPNRVKAQGLDPTLSIDGVNNGGLKAYEHLFQDS